MATNRLKFNNENTGLASETVEDAIVELKTLIDTSDTNIVRCGKNGTDRASDTTINLTEFVPNSTNSLLVFLNGELLTYGNHYTLELDTNNKLSIFTTTGDWTLIDTDILEFIALKSEVEYLVS